MSTVLLLDTKLHNRKAFVCGEPELDDYLRTKANQDVKRNVAVCYVLPAADDPATIAGYYTISSLSVQFTDLPGALRKSLPPYQAIPATLIGRLAVSEQFKGNGFGEGLLMDALERVHELSKQQASAVVIVDLLNASAGNFYSKYGFFPLPNQSDRMFMSMDTIKQLFE